jgi:hypothetical protein
LEKPGEKVKRFFPKWMGEIHLVGCISVQKESMKEQ